MVLSGEDFDRHTLSYTSLALLLFDVSACNDHCLLSL